MNLQQEIDELERQLRQKKALQSNCKHVFGKAAYNPYQGTESYSTGRYEQNVGIHMWPEMATRQVEKLRWTRTCTICGMPQHTEKQKDVSIKREEPDFS